VPGVVVGVGSDVPDRTDPARFRRKRRISRPFAIYIGRIDENKGCAELFSYFLRYTRMFAQGLDLVLIGNPIIPIPQHPRVHHLGFVSDEDKFDALAAAELLIMPSYFESLSMVALEAWALGKPVLANARCDVLKGQCIRSNGGLYYEDFAEFAETLRAIDFSPSLAAALGRNGRDYFNRHYTWPIIERKYLEMFERLKREPATALLEPLPGWFGRRRQTVPPGDDVVAQLPRGAVIDSSPSAGHGEVRPESRGTLVASDHKQGHHGRGETPAIAAPVPPIRVPAAAEMTANVVGPAARTTTPADGQPPSFRPSNRFDRPGERPRNDRHRGGAPHRGPHRRRRPGGRPPRRSGS
jgi:hypothetical protein